MQLHRSRLRIMSQPANDQRAVLGHPEEHSDDLRQACQFLVGQDLEDRARTFPDQTAEAGGNLMSAINDKQIVSSGVKGHIDAHWSVIDQTSREVRNDTLGLV